MNAQIELRNKVIKFDDYISIKKQLTRERVVQCHGVFDLLHIGHIRHFQMAKKHGDVLVVTITPDIYVNKGPNRPSFHETLRAEAIAALEYVDYVIINSWPTAVEAIKLIQPNIYFKGSEYKDVKNDLTAKIQEEVSAVESVGGRVEFSDDITFSSSKLINQYLPHFSEEVVNYLKRFKIKYNAANVFDYLDKAKNLHVLVVGESIIDIYNFSEVIGKSGKEPILAAKHKYEETYIGGVLALANHLSDFCKKITCLTYLGENGEHEDTIRANLKPNVDLVPIYKKNSPTIVKRRYLEEYLQQKLFEVYEINDDFLNDEEQIECVTRLNKLLDVSDLTIVADYGHGLLNEEAVSSITKNSKFLAVNTQSNASNHGFNCISKYARADYISIASRELQLNYRQKHLSISEQLNRVMSELHYKIAMITTGKNGAYVCKQNEDIYVAPAFATSVVDRVGAGDAVLALTSLYAYLNASAEIIAFVGNVVGAEAVGIMGNQRHINKVSFMKHIEHLLK